MIPPELQPRSFRPYIADSITSPSSSFSSYPTASPYSPNSNFPSSSTSSSRSRFSASFFAHNTRIALALAPCSAFLLGLGGTPVVTILTLGLMIAYILDSLNFKSGAFFGVWASLITAQIAFFFSSSLIFTFNSIPLGLLAAFLCAQMNFLLGAWASLQFKWIQLENPPIMLALELLLFACVPFAASSIFTWATIFAFGMATEKKKRQNCSCDGSPVGEQKLIKTAIFLNF